MKVLCVAEKPSISKAVTEILSGGQFTSRQSSIGWIKNYDFSYRLGWPGQGNGHAQITMTCVAGHLTEVTWADEERYKSWAAIDPFELFDAQVTTVIRDPNMQGIARNLQKEARQADVLMIWTDCDREGEHIGKEIMDTVRKVKAGIQVKRARFSAIIPQQIHNACRNPIQLDLRQAAAVAARIDLDLRIGAAMTRLTTLGLQSRIPQLDRKVVSYGSCQFPTLGFVVDQYDKVRHFVSEPFWYIDVTLERDDDQVVFKWKRHRLFDWQIAVVLYEICAADPEATVLSVATKPTSKWKPLPLTTVELQKSGSRLLHMSPKTILDTAEKLYQRGFLSYPRTETDQYDKDFDFQELIAKQTTDAAWGQFAQQLQNGGFERPRNGKKNDQAHPPIHPTAHAGNLVGDEKKVYDLITRRFLASCSQNATGSQTTVNISIGGEEFSASGLVVLQRNYLEVYPFDKWANSALPNFRQGEKFHPSSCVLKEGGTSPPSLLTEADLVNLMDKNGIGTDATIAEHIAKIIDREYVMKQREGRTEYLVPSTLGCGLVEGFNKIDFDQSLCKPNLRRETEQRMNLICTGANTKQEVIDESIEEYRDVFLRTRQQFNLVVESVDGLLNGPPEDAEGGDHDGNGSDHLSSNDENNNDEPPQPPQAPPRRQPRGEGPGRGRSAAKRDALQPPVDEDSADDRPQPKKRKTKGDSADVPNCKCGKPAVERTVKQATENQGRAFYGCAEYGNAGCKFFEFKAQSSSTSKGKKPLQNTNSRQRQAAQEETVRCKCELVAVLKTVGKEGATKGKLFYTCGCVSREASCGFFQWADEAKAPDRPIASTSKPLSNYTCFKCGEEGHLSTLCTNAAQPNRGSSTRGRGRGSRGRGRTTGRGAKSSRGASRAGPKRGRASKTNKDMHRRVDSESDDNG